MPESEVDKIIDCYPPQSCSACNSEILITKVHRHQVYEIPAFNYEVLEYKKYKGCCSSCSKKYEGNYPSGVTNHCLGSRAQGLIGLLTSKFRLSKRLVENFFKETFGLLISLGTVSNTEAVVSEALAGFYTGVQESLKLSKIVHIDETSHKEKNKNGWAWIVGNEDSTLFALRRSRGRKVATELIGSYFGRTFVTDRYAAYDYLPDKNRQVCWAHLKRDFKKISERGGGAGRSGIQLLKAHKRIFELWRNEPLERRLHHKKTKQWFRRAQRKIIYFLEAGAHCGHKQTMNTCQNLLSLQDALWTFWGTNVPPTNNQAERQLRPLVISKKLTFGTQSDRGSRFIERIFTAIMTCQQRKIPILNFLNETVLDFFRDLVPSTN